MGADHAAQQGFTGGLKLRDGLVKFQLKLFTSPDFDRRYAAPYSLIIGTKIDDKRVDFFKTFKEVFEATYVKTGEKPAVYYGVDARLSLIIARRGAGRGRRGLPIHPP